MGLEQNNEQQYREIPTKNFNSPVDTYQMTPYDLVLRPDATAKSFTITLPPVAECQGRWYSILLRAVGQGFGVTVTDSCDSECWVGNCLLDTKCDRLLLHSDGLTWFVFFAALNAPS
jgi:hypothetical protein